MYNYKAHIYIYKNSYIYIYMRIQKNIRICQKGGKRVFSEDI